MPNILSEETIKITTQGVMKAEADLDRLKGKTSSFSEMVRGVSRGLVQFDRNLHRIARAVSVFSIGGAAGLGAIFHGGFKGTQEANALSQAWEQFARVISDRFAPYVRMLALALQDATTWFGSLSEATRDSIVQWTMIGAGIAGVVAILPVLLNGFAGILGVFAAIISPAGLLIATIGGIIAAAVTMFNLFQTGGADAADSLNQSNQSWMQSLIKGLHWITNAFINFFNWLMKQWHDVQKSIAGIMADIGERTGALPLGTLANVLEDFRREGPLQIDVKGLDEFFGKVQRNVGLVEANLDGLGGKIANWAHDLKLAAGPGGATPAGKAAFESSQSMWERLQKGLMGQDTRIPEKQLEQQKAANVKLDGILGAIEKIRPAVV